MYYRSITAYSLCMHIFLDGEIIADPANQDTWTPQIITCTKMHGFKRFLQEKQKKKSGKCRSDSGWSDPAVAPWIQPLYTQILPSMARSGSSSSLTTDAELHGGAGSHGRVPDRSGGRRRYLGELHLAGGRRRTGCDASPPAVGRRGCR